MANELDVPFNRDEPLGLAMILDGRESVAVPSFVPMGGGDGWYLRPMIVGPLLIQNHAENSIQVEIAESEDPALIGRWMIGDNIGGVRIIEIAERKAEVISPLRTYVGLRFYAGGEAGDVVGLVRCVGILSRGPAAMPRQEPIPIGLG